MQFVPIFTLREGVFVAAAAVAVILLFLWFLARLSHRPYIVRDQDQSDSSRVVAIQLGRIADSIDRLARSLESRTSIEEVSAAAPAEERPHGMSLSMFGR